MAFSLEGGGKKEKVKKKSSRGSLSLLANEREPRRFSGLLVIEIQPTFVPPSSPLPYFLSLSLPFLSPPAQNHPTATSLDLPTFKIDFPFRSLIPPPPPRFVYESRRGHEALEMLIQRRHYTRGRVDTADPFELENPRIRKRRA